MVSRDASSIYASITVQLNPNIEMNVLIKLY